ncbi:GNAT family N-acetyltransferase [uncultured Kordia sp.]|uniref:GNAT family N-acetyltransferase n=1 Tax=uncultured Kordia sp. TaxID=507699 RepID=UPI002638A4D0|nr:GNAT family N-acetyltransferase [uncultured Kordia sp.]
MLSFKFTGIKKTGEMQTAIIGKEVYSITMDIEKLNMKMIHQYLSKESYWAKDIPLKMVKKSIENSLNFGVFHEKEQIGFARLITDKTTMAYLCDVFIIEAYQKKGLSSWLMKSITTHPELQHLRLWILLTSSADWLYEKFGFYNPKKPELYMEKRNKINYKNV